MVTYSRQDAATWAGLTVSRIEYLQKLNVIAPDVGDVRKRFSLHEARMTVIVGCLLTDFGVDPKLLVDPIAWLREGTLMPADANKLTLTELSLELIADGIRAVSTKDNQISQPLLNFLTREIYFARSERDYFNLDDAEKHKRFDEAKKSQDQNVIDLISESALHAIEMSSSPLKWSGHEYHNHKWALNFELACRQKANLYIHFFTGESGWSIKIDTSPSQLDGPRAWIVIDVRRLFGEKKLFNMPA